MALCRRKGLQVPVTTNWQVTRRSRATRREICVRIVLRPYSQRFPLEPRVHSLLVGSGFWTAEELAAAQTKELVAQ